MMIDVPQNINVEDKIVGPLTAKQLGWMGVLGVILVILWNMVAKALFFIIGIPVALVFGALAFYRPYGQSLSSFIMFGVMYFFRPKVYFWKRSETTPSVNPQNTGVQKKEDRIVDKHISSAELSGLAHLLDSEGLQYDQKLQEILKNAPVKK
jgi:hypothetical protein